MEVPKFKEFITETDIGRRDKPMTIALCNGATTLKTLKKIQLLILYKSRVRKKH